MSYNLRGLWQSKINNSSIELASKVIKCKQDDKNIPHKLQIKINLSLGILVFFSIVFGVVNGLDIREWVNSPGDYILIGLWVTSAFFYVWYSRKEHKSEYEKYRELLIKKLNTGFCPCTDACNHKEEFMKYMDDIYDIKLYY